MKKLIVLLVVLACVVPALALDDPDVAYVGGTVSDLKAGTIGRLDTTQQDKLVFQYIGGRVEIVYDKIESYAYSREVAVHLGVVAATAVGLVKRRWRQHYLRVSYKDADGKNQVAVFEIPKTMPRVIMGILESKAPKGCKPANSACRGF